MYKCLTVFCESDYALFPVKVNPAAAWPTTGPVHKRVVCVLRARQARFRKRFSVPNSHSDTTKKYVPKCRDSAFSNTIFGIKGCTCTLYVDLMTLRNGL